MGITAVGFVISLVNRIMAADPGLRYGWNRVVSGSGAGLVAGAARRVQRKSM
jgi:hypothetical protein